MISSDFYASLTPLWRFPTLPKICLRGFTCPRLPVAKQWRNSGETVVKRLATSLQRAWVSPELCLHARWRWWWRWWRWWWRWCGGLPWGTNLPLTKITQLVVLFFCFFYPLPHPLVGVNRRLRRSITLLLSSLRISSQFIKRIRVGKSRRELLITLQRCPQRRSPSTPPK